MSRRRCRIGVQLPEVERRVAWPELIDMARTAAAIIRHVSELPTAPGGKMPEAEIMAAE